MHTYRHSLIAFLAWLGPCLLNDASAQNIKPSTPAIPAATKPVALAKPPAPPSPIVSSTNAPSINANSAKAPLAAKLPAGAKVVVPKVYTLSIGVDTGAKSGEDLYAGDAQFFHDLQTSADPARARIVKGDDATLANVVSELRWLKDSMGKEDVGIIYISAHGSVKKKAAKEGTTKAAAAKSNESDEEELVIKLARPKNDRPSEYGFDLTAGELFLHLEQAEGRIVLFVDTCASGALVDSLSKTKSISLLLAAAKDQDSLGDPESKMKYPHGYFTIALHEALQGYADTAPIDGHVSLREIGRYVSGRVESLYWRQKTILSPAGDLEAVVLKAIKKPVGDPPPYSRVLENPFGEPFDVQPLRDGEATPLVLLAEFPVPALDPNADSWAKVKVDAKIKTLEGTWSSRYRADDKSKWNYGTAEIKGADGQYYFHFEGDETYLMNANLVEGRFTGRYNEVHHLSTNTGLWVGKVIGFDRIDGIYGDDGAGRWDFRRVKK